MSATPDPAAAPGSPSPPDHELVGALVSAQRWDAALQALAPALAADPGNPRLLGLLVRTLRGQGRRQEAVDAARRLLTVAPEDPYAFRLATLVLLDVGWVDEAIGLAVRAVTLDPHNAANHLALSRAWAQSGRPGAVRHQLAAAREAVLLEPNSPDAQVQIGAALAADADIEGARAAYRAALRLDPANPAALNNLAVLDLRSGDHAAAVRGLSAALTADPQDAVARRNLDTVALRTLRRLGWLLALAPVPALVAARLGQPGLSRVLAVAVLLGVPVAVIGFLRALSPGQRRALRDLPHRLRWWSWVWPAAAAAAGGWALATTLVAPAGVSGTDVIAYLLVVGALAMFRVLTVLLRPSWRAEAAARRARWRRAGSGGR
jgi:Flp pilus assembly protein TadD